MDEYDELWDAIMRSPFFGVYVRDVYWHTKYVVQETAKIFSDTPAPAQAGEGYIRVDEALHGRIQSVLVAAARTRALIRNRNRDGSRAEREVLARRTAALQQLLDGIDLAPVLDGAARHSIEHFDEYMDGVTIQSYKGMITRPTLFAVDMVLSTRRLLERFDVGGARPTTYFIRAYIADERVFTNCGRELKLGPLHECCSAIRKRVESLLPDFAQDQKGAPMLVITESSFRPGIARDSGNESIL